MDIALLNMELLNTKSLRGRLPHGYHLVYLHVGHLAHLHVGHHFSKVHGFSAGRPNMSSRQSSFRLEAIENEMWIARRTKWWLPGGHKCRATGALGEAGKSSLVSGGAEMWRNSISYHPALYIANCLFWKARKKNFQLFRALKPQPTS